MSRQTINSIEKKERYTPSLPLAIALALFVVIAAVIFFTRVVILRARS